MGLRDMYSAGDIIEYEGGGRDASWTPGTAPVARSMCSRARE